MALPIRHQCRVLPSPWSGVHGIQTDSARSFKRHSHATYGIGLLEYGSQRSASGRGEVVSCAGDLITSNPEEVHDGRPLGESARRWTMLQLDQDVIASMLNPGASTTNLELTQPVIRDVRLSATLRQLLQRIDHWNNGLKETDADVMACEESLVQTCGYLLATHCTTAQKIEDGGNVARARDRLADEVLETPTLAELATMTGLSRFQMLRRFTHLYGVPPHAWLLQQRVERAKRLISGGEALTSAALAAGFSDQSHMTRVFGRLLGFTPGAWQQAARGRL